MTSARRALEVETTEIDPVEDLLEYTDPRTPHAFVRRGDGIAAAGPALATIEARGTGRVAELADRMRALAADARIVDPIESPGTGLVAFGALAFDERSASPSTLVIPSAVVGRRRGRSWLTRIRWSGDDAPPAAGGGPGGTPLRPVPYGPHWAGTVGPGTLRPEGYQDAVRRALTMIADGRVAKVVLARDVVGVLPPGSDLRRLARALSTGYPDTWTFAVDGIIGASPETLVTVAGGTVTARVLAGTVARGADADADVAASAFLATSAKNLDEHRFAVQSVLASLRPFTTALAASDHPFTLKLPNLWHLATDVEGELARHAGSLELVAALHPTAAVAGTPRDAALSAIAELEPFDRGRYAGPVGWVDGDGDGEWAIALRCAQFAPPDAAGQIGYVAHTGAGIVAASDPEAELMETRVKFRPIVDAMA